jgi:K+-transporting ATPase KdpF subunit
VREINMEAIIMLVVTGLMLAYLLYALLCPEKF